MEAADLEIAVEKLPSQAYRIRAQFAYPDDVGPRRLFTKDDRRDEPLDEQALHRAALNDEAYGALLGEFLLGDPEVFNAFDRARTAAAAANAPLRLRLHISSSAPELLLHNWERMIPPGDTKPISANERLRFIRFLESGDMRRVDLRAEEVRRILVAVANPTDLHQYTINEATLPRFDAVAEVEAIRALTKLPVETLPLGASATLDAIAATLRKRYDILYLIAHGVVQDGEMRLVLQAPNGEAKFVPAEAFAQRIVELEHRPRLVILGSCLSGGDGSGRVRTNGTLAAAGPVLVEGGVPAVVAMQGNITEASLRTFSTAFFSELVRDGQIDRAVTVARQALLSRETPDWWMPVLFTWLASGEIHWYTPGFAAGDGLAHKWKDIRAGILGRSCTPLLGPVLHEPYFGSPRRVAVQWAKEEGLPLSPMQPENLAHVAQFLSAHHDQWFVRTRLLEVLQKELCSRFPELQTAKASGMGIDELTRQAGQARWATRQDHDPHIAVARLKLPIYITTDPSPLLTEAIRFEGGKPVTDFTRWHEDLFDPTIVPRQVTKHQPSPEQPLVFHLFGRFDAPESLVITEDDFCDYLIGVAKYQTQARRALPQRIEAALMNTSLLFLGFDLEDWSFRALYRTILGLSGRQRMQWRTHVAAQVDPEATRILNPEHVRKFLEELFKDAKLNIYWGSVEDFLEDLDRHLTIQAAA